MKSGVVLKLYLCQKRFYDDILFLIKQFFQQTKLAESPII